MFSTDVENNKVAHANFVSSSLKARGGDARTWASKVTDIIGGKVSLTLGFNVVFPNTSNFFFYRLVERKTVRRVLELMPTRLMKLWLLRKNI